ncbi:hypothetical protein M408DRAFT_247845 [Serendipita vermifera MAFF 305830]|uniref:Uncharacterized protein n=1 Tax=Serendipita vermifera MAFF 305830 TaxID=933852 RepID=A0A0C3AH70_SERVB|nr:hypothetical protein M408DRAFT_247845 [Serendipita vermifera MAFF 305830]
MAHCRQLLQFWEGYQVAWYSRNGVYYFMRTVALTPHRPARSVRSLWTMPWYFFLFFPFCVDYNSSVGVMRSLGHYRRQSPSR